MGNLFSSFDPRSRILFIELSYGWVSILRVLLLRPQYFWVAGNQLGAGFKLVIKLLLLELGAIFGGLAVPGVSLMFLSFFFFILRSNFLGLMPYVFTPSSHLVFTLALSLPLWLGSVLWSVVYQFKRIMAHLVPLGTPAALMPAMVVIETISSIIRPMTLAVRLAANIIAGHLLLTLLGGIAPGGNVTLVMVALVLLLMLESAVACIQSYVFTILRSLYLNELIRPEFRKKFIR